jgi:hypothetical protein
MYRKIDYDCIKELLLGNTLKLFQCRFCKKNYIDNPEDMYWVAESSLFSARPFCDEACFNLWILQTKMGSINA